MISKAEFIEHRGTAHSYEHAINRVKWRWFVHTKTFNTPELAKGYLSALIEALLVLQYMHYHREEL